jgi:DhnA family fructose-bisphosphate aldolase class Ia
MNLLASSFEFGLQTFFPERILEMITDVRVDDPGLIEKSAKRRKRRQKLTSDGKLAILACDHPARRVTKSGKDPLLMGNRQEYLGRVLRVVSNPEFDGVMGTTDVIEDLLIVDQLIVERGGPSFLDNRVLLGCMNRGGLSEASFEMDDRFTSFTAESIKNMHLDGAKLMFRLDLKDDRSLYTIEACAKAITELNKLSLPAFLEPLSVERTADGYKMFKTPEELIKNMSVATALGDSSKGIWLKIPYCDGFDKVAKATTCPILMLGGESSGDPASVLADFSKGLVAGYNVRGALVGRNVLFPGREDPSAIAEAVSRIIHQNYSLKQAMAHIANTRGQGLDRLSAFFK